MTTVGYGDIAPVGVPGRVFAIIWILAGLVIIAIFTGAIATSLTVVAMSSSLKLYGTKVRFIIKAFVEKKSKRKLRKSSKRLQLIKRLIQPNCLESSTSGSIK